MAKDADVQMVPVDKIHVTNPRNRNRRKFELILASIAEIGLKRPIKVSPRKQADAVFEYDLVCGQGRLQAFIELGQTEIPAFVEDLPREERLIMSLVENIARRTPRMLEMAQQVGVLRDRGYTNADISRKIAVDESLVGGVLRLLDHGEERLLQAVESGRIPMTVAIIIATSEDKKIQHALSEAYEKHGLRGKGILQACRIVEQRRTYGKCINRNGRSDKHSGSQITSESIVRAFEQESKRQRLAIKKASFCHAQLIFIVNAIKSMLADEHFVTLLRAESMDTLPAYLADEIGGK